MRTSATLVAALALILAACGEDGRGYVSGGPTDPLAAASTPETVYTTPGSGTTPGPPSTTSEPDEALPAVVAARTDLATRFERPATDVEVLSVTPMTWPDACLNVTFLDRQDEVCAQVITPGYVVVLKLDANAYTYHTDQSGVNVRFAGIDIGAD